MDDVSFEDSMDANLQESICIDDVIFYGPVTSKEKLIRERFEKRQKEKAKENSQLMLFKEELTKECPEYKKNTFGENKNEFVNDSSIYESFSIDESKYDSFEDSLDEGNCINPKEVNVSQFHSEQVNVNFRKTRNKQMFRGTLCDSLEDIHSLVSNVEKLSISEDIENINILENNHIYDDSLKNDFCFENKNTNSVEQNFDDDSLAILEFEKAFDDSLEEADLLPLLRNGMSDAEISVENLTKENVCITKNLFETSVEVIFENVRNGDILEGNCEILKHSTGDSLSISENMSKDSLDDKHIQQQPHEKTKDIVPSTIINEIQDRKTVKSECVGTTENIETGLNFKNAVNLMDGLGDSIGEEPASSLENALNSKDEILIEDSCSLSSNTEYGSAKSKLSVNENIKENLFQVNETILIDDSINHSADTILSNCSFTEENHCDISEKKICEGSSNDTIWVDDSFSVCYKSCMNKEINLVNKKPESIIQCITEIISPIKDKESGKQEENETSSHLNDTINIDDSRIISHLNDTINIDDSYIIPMEPAYNKSTESSVKKISKIQSIDDKNHKGNNLKTNVNQFNKNCATSVKNSQFISPFCNKVEKVTIANALNSPLNEYIKSSVQDASEFKNPKKETKTFEDAFVPAGDLPNEANLKLQVEVAFDKNQGLNIISISTVEQCPQSELNLASEINSKNATVGINQNSNFNNSRESINSSIASRSNLVEKNLEKKEKLLDINKPNGNIANTSKQIRMFPDKNYVNVQVESNVCDAQLLQALDLHDISYSASGNRYLQSRDSIMPLNLCIRNQSQGDPFLTKSENKENITMNCNCSKTLEKGATISDHSKRNSNISQTTDKTPKHFNTIVDVKKSGNKVNSGTKIPVRKVDGTFPTPVHQKIGKNYNSVSSAEKPAKSPIVKSASATDSLSSLKENTPKKLHFCTVRNSISRVPKSAQRPTAKKFQYIESPIAKYIRKAQIHTPLITTHRYDGNVVFGNGSKTSKSTVHNPTVKTPSSAIKESPKISSKRKV